jgi:hypothetical protein
MEWRDVGRGVPQGSCLSPLLFNIYVRNMPTVSDSKTFQFADDITNSEADRDPAVVLERLLDSFNKTKAFCDMHELIVNASKTQLIILKAPSKKIADDLELAIDGCVIKPASSVKLLGLTIDRHLTFGEHIGNVVSKCHSLIGVLSRAAPYLTKELRRLMYIALIRSQLEYCCAVTSSASSTQLKKLDTIQNIASRIITGAPRDAHAAPLLEALCLESLQTRRVKHVVDLVARITTGEIHPAFKDMFSELDDGTLANSVNSRIGVGRRRFSVRGKDLYNSDQDSCGNTWITQGVEEGPAS